MAKKKPEKRLQILSAGEIKELYQRPIFNLAEREEYFALDEPILNKVKNMRKLENKLTLVLLLGYFRAKPVVPKFRLSEVKADISYLCKKYFPGEKPKYPILARNTRSALVNTMLSLLGFDRLTKKTEKELATQLRDVATICTEPRYIFDECLAFFGQKKIALAGYTTLQDLITFALSHERSRTEGILSEKMTDATRLRLKKILKTNGLLSQLSVYKGSARGFSPSEIERELHTHDTIREVYPELKHLIASLALSQGNLTYYASIVQHQSLYKLRRQPEYQGLLCLVCYLFFRYRETNDKLVTAFIYLTRKHDEASKAAAKQRIADELELVRNKLKYAGSILRYFVDDDINDGTEFGEVRETAFKLISRDEIAMISQHLRNHDFDKADYQWQYTDKNHRKISNTLRKLFLAIEFECDAGYPALSHQLASAKESLKTSGRIEFTDQHTILKSDRPYLIKDGDVNLRRFEYYLYYRVYRMLNNNTIYITESADNKLLEDDLISPTDWKDNTNEWVRKTGLSRLTTPISSTLQALNESLLSSMQHVSQCINASAYEFVKRATKPKELLWSIASKRWKEDVDNPVYTQLRHLSIIEIMHYVNQQTGFLKSFKNVSTRKRSVAANDDDLLAVLFANGSGHGIYGISNSSDRSIGSLKTVDEGYVHLESTGTANDVISNGIEKMPVFSYYTINEAAPFGSIDGQKHRVRINTFKARFSAKYFRKGKGVSALTLVSNFVPVNTEVISPNDYEAHYAFDLLYNNESDIQTKTLATDNHGINSVNFAILDLFGYQFAPRYAKFKNIFNDQFEIVSGSGDDIEIQLKRPINGKLIEQEWDEIQRIICSLSRKTASQSTIVRKLSNNKRNLRTLAALHEYDRMIKCQYLLDYIDNKTLRHFVQKTLNRGEAFHQLRKAISAINGSQFRGGSDYQIAQWNDCSRLIANCIIYYNSALLSGLIEKFKERNNQKVVDMISQLSPIAWRHILLAGHYTFGGEKTGIDVAELLAEIDPAPGEADEVLAA